ncbi:MAG TPA: ATP-binding protein [Terriglobales bacterium]|nr:ATP-binding protein [Terriglobales bacterium]
MQARSQTAEQQRISKEFAFPGDVDSLASSRQALMDFLAPYCAGEAEELDIFIALQEALANAVLHGCQNDASKTIQCRVEIDPSALLITVRDPGPGFDSGMATESTEAGTNVSQHGRGICLMRSLMDEVSYRHGGTELQLRKLRAASA